MKGKDAKTGEIKTYTLIPGDTIYDVAKKFNYF
jgi:hypothetical protein